MDLATLRRMLLKLEKGISRNQQLRIKYPNDPDKYVCLCTHTER
jgi:beta-catenin-like protein 1